METELKLNVAQRDLDKVRQHALLAGLSPTGPDELELADTYYDTPKLDLWRNGLTLRVRASDGNWVQTVKTAATGAPALHQRGEWECALPGPTPDPAALVRQVKTKRVAELLASSDVAARLRPVFNNTTRRTRWNIELPDGQQVECVLDAGDLHVGKRNAAIGELELEMKKGDPTRLFELALALHQQIPLRIANDSKAARGYALLDRQAPAAVKATPVRLHKKMRLEDALQCIGLNCLAQLESNVTGVLAQSVESLHQMRVGLRRLRALLNMFEDLAPLPADMRDSIEWLSGALGATRDWDVLAGSTLPAIGAADVAQLVAVAEQRARDLHRDMLQTLHQPRYTQVILQLNGWFHGRGWRDGLADKSPLYRRVDDAMLPLLRKARQRLRKRIGALDENDLAARHRVRIAAKKARYAAEFFSDLLPAKPTRHYVRTLSALQDKLGHLNDLAVARGLLEQLTAPDLLPGTTYARGYIAAALDLASHQLRPALDAVARLKLTAE